MPYTKQNGETSLIAGAMKGHIDVVQFLISKGANVQAKTKVA